MLFSKKKKPWWRSRVQQITMFQLFLLCNKLPQSLSGLKQSFYYAYGFCGSGIWAGHSRNGSSLLWDVWDLKWEGPKLVVSRQLEASSLMCLVPGLGWLADQDCRPRCLQVALLCGLVSSQHGSFWTVQLLTWWAWGSRCERSKEEGTLPFMTQSHQLNRVTSSTPCYPKGSQAYRDWRGM